MHACISRCNETTAVSPVEPMSDAFYSVAVFSSKTALLWALLRSTVPGISDERYKQGFHRSDRRDGERKAGYGLEVPCVFRLYGPKAYIDKIKELVEALFVDGLLLLTRNTRTHNVFGRRGFRLSVRGGN